MHIMLIVLAAASQLLYEAQVASFGCNSSAEVSQLLSIRSDPKAFQQRLFEQFFYGQCIAIAPGAVVEGKLEADDPKVLRVQGRSNPPGYMAPLVDFKLKGDEPPKADDKPQAEESKAAESKTEAKPKAAEQTTGDAAKP